MQMRSSWPSSPPSICSAATPSGSSALGRFLAMSSLLLWAGAVTAGRLMAYL